MVKRGTTGLVVCMLLALGPPLWGQSEPDQKPRIRVWIPGRFYPVSVDLWLYSGKDPMFVPYCGTDESGREHLCTLATHLEKKTPQGWRTASLRDATLTGKSLVFAAGEQIPPNSKGEFTFVFDTDAFGIPPGTRLRVVVDTWPNQNSMRARDQPLQVISPEFVCPP